LIQSDVYKALGLTEEDYKRILKLIKREPTPTELAMFSVEWSEHCGYLRSKKYLVKLPKDSKYETLVGEDAGGIVVNDLALIFKMESHNHPSQVEPRQGAATGIGGILRDIFTTGARPIALMDSLRFGEQNDPYSKYVYGGVIDGIQFYGNCVGVPTVGGEIYFDDAYKGNCLVNVFCLGVCNKDEIARAIATGVGNIIIYAGSATGRDGIGGCSVLASAEFGCDEEKRPTVQIGDPFTEKCLIEATLEALKTGHVLGIKDMGAAGLTCSTSEMAYAGGVGMEVDITNVPTRESGMQPYELMMSESQERMLLCVKAGKEKEILKLFHRWGLNAVTIGKVTKSKNLKISYKGKVVCNLDPKVLTNPVVFDMPYEEPSYIKDVRNFDFDSIPETTDYNDVLLKLISSPNIASKWRVYEQYDHMVRLNTVILPGSDAAVLRITQKPPMGIAMTTDCNGRYCYLNPYKGAQIAVAEAARNLVCSGADPAAVTDCLNFANPDKPDRYWQFKNCIEGIIDSCKFFKTPVISGNVSFYNESPNGPIYPTPTIGMIGILKDVNKRVTQWFKNEGDIIFLLGETKDELGGSEYLKVIHGKVAGDCPDVDLKAEANLHKAILEAVGQGIVNSAHDCSEGGLGIALSECCISGPKLFGADIKLPKLKIRNDSYLFGESQGRVIVTVYNKNVAKFNKICKQCNVPTADIGRITGKNFIINDLIKVEITSLDKSWRHSL